MLVKIYPRNDDEEGAGTNGERKNWLAPCVSPAMRALESVLRDIATTEMPVLLLGETGTGKEVVAFAIHQLSLRHGGPFVKIPCSSLNPQDFDHLALESEAELGSSHPSTFFLDEISDMSAACQARLLEAFWRLDGGSEHSRAGSVISTTCHDLEAAMQGGQFRHELYYRLSGVCLKIPPLRERREDVLPLANFFLDKYSALFARERPRLSAWAAALLHEYEWPGNVRELENTMKRLVALGDEHLAFRDLAEASKRDAMRKPSREFGSLKEAAREASRQAERELILKVLAHTRWNRKRAAEELQVSYKALLYKLKQIGLEEPTS